MIIGIDGNEANTTRRVGISEYAFELLCNFKKIKKPDLQFIIYLKNKPLQDMPKESEDWKYRIFGPKKLWTQFALPLQLLLEKEKPDVFFTPSHYSPRIARMPTVIAIMDASYLHFPDLFAKKDLYQLVNWTAYSAHKAKKIFTISQSSKNDIINYYKIAEKNVVVTYPGIKNISLVKGTSMSMKSLEEKYGISKKFILFVGTIQPRKNIVRLIEAFSFITKKHTDIELVIIGKKGWLYETILHAPDTYHVGEKVHFLDFVNNEELATFYQHALFYILPSLYEGFGLPILEAMQYGCPVITSNVSSLPEAGGDACLYVDPLNVDDISKKMEQLIENEHLRKKLVEKGYAHLKKFSWEKAAQQTLTVLEEIGKKNT